MTRKKENTWLKVAIIVGAIAVVALVIFLIWMINNNNNPDPQFDTPRDVLVTDGKDNTEKTEQGQTDSTDAGDEKEEIPQYDGDDPNLSENLTGALTYAKIMKDSEANEVLVLRVNIDQYITEGNCSLTIKNGEESVYTGEAAIIGSASTSTCTGFDVPASSLGTGNMKIEINLSTEGKTGVITGEVNI